MSGRLVVLVTSFAAVIVPADAGARGNPPYTTYGSFADLMVGNNARYPELIRISEPGTKESPNYTGFFFYQCLQFDPTDRYVLGTRVHCQNRDVQPTDRAEIGVIDLQDGHKWAQIGETTAWNWQQGARMQWRPGSDEILWNDRSDDGSHYVCRVYNFKTGARRTLPRPIYTPSPDGAVALTHDFERMKHGGTPYVGIKDKYEGRYAPKDTGIWRMDLSTGDATLIMSLDQMSRMAYPAGAPSSGCLYVFREGWNSSGSRFIAFLKDPDNNLDKAYSMTAAGTDVRYFYHRPSHHEWQDDTHILDGRGYYLYPDDGTGKATGRLFESSENGHVSYIPGPGGDWIVSDTYDINGYQYLFMYHIPTKRFVPLARLKSTAPTNIYRVDLHPRLSRSGRIVCIDATHEGLGRQMYIIDIGYILDNPPAGQEQPRRELLRKHLADYDSELRRPDGRVDIDAMVARLKELGVTTYYWLIWHAPADWDDLKLFLPKAAEAGIDVWAYLVPPSESPPSYGGQYSEPFRLDYHRWAEEIARLSLQHANLTAWVIDDFYANHELFTPAYLREMQAKAKRINPRLAFLPLMYFDEIRARFAEDYREVIDGVVVAYLQDRDEIDWTWAILNDAAVIPPSELSYPWNTPSSAGDFVTASQSVKVLPADRYVLSFRERDDFTGPTAGYHFKQLVVDGVVVWEEDMAGGSAAWRKVTLDVTEQARGKAGVTVGFRLLDKKAVSNFGVRWRVDQLRGENLQFAADLAEPGKWKVDRKGAFEAGFGSETKSGQRRFHIPFISMTAADQGEFRQRHGEPATPERVAEWLRVSLQAWQDGKCDGVVTYCLDKRPQSQTFALAQRLFHDFGNDTQPLVVSKQEVRILAGMLERVIGLANGNLSTIHLQVSGRELLGGPAPELSVTVMRAEPNARPMGLKAGQGGVIDSVKTFQPGQHVDPDTYDDASLGQTTRWVEPVRIQANRWAEDFTLAVPQVATPAPDVSRLTILAHARKGSVLDGLAFTVVYEVYRGEPVVRKWVEIANESSVWRKIEQLTIDDFALAASISERVPLTPAGYGVQPSLIGCSSSDGTFGVIAASEIPSALRSIASTGAMGYHPAMFEWVLAPGERFVSEPVFLYAFSGPVEQTISARSMPLDRAVEGPFQRFLSRHVGIAGEQLPCDAPQWLTWANFGPNLNDAMIRQQADLAARAGFVQFLLDDGWQRDRLGTEPDVAKFPDFAATAAYIRSRGLKLGLWLSCFRDKDSPDLKALPDARSLPVVTRLGGIAMGFTTPWRELYAQDLARLHERYGVAYVKQDFSNIIYGDLAENHPNRTRKESLLRGLRGLLEAQDRLRALAPDMMNQMTHEIYWDTPGAPCDLAALKHAARYHVSPNACGGIVSRRTKASAVDPQKVRAELLAACGQSRQIFYSHRGLPLYCLEFYGAATEDHQGSLTADVQDRQVVSWLLGAPLVFSGDLSTLSPEHLAHYQKRFALVNRLHQSWDIYRHFQFSGVPAPNDDDWHWWGKLNDEGCGAVVVVRGSGGAARRAINIPWVKPDRPYTVVALFSDQRLGEFTGRQLQSAGVEIALPVYGQEILELTPAGASGFETRPYDHARYCVSTLWQPPAGLWTSVVEFPSRIQCAGQPPRQDLFHPGPGLAP